MSSLTCPTCRSGMWIGKPLNRLCLMCKTRTVSPGGDEGQRLGQQRRRAQMTPGQVLEQSRRTYRRRQAREQSRETGQPIDQILALWGSA